jgi:hypothetical protein
VRGRGVNAARAGDCNRRCMRTLIMTGTTFPRESALMMMKDTASSS